MDHVMLCDVDDDCNECQETFQNCTAEKLHDFDAVLFTFQHGSFVATRLIDHRLLEGTGLKASVVPAGRIICIRVRQRGRMCRHGHVEVVQVPYACSISEASGGSSVHHDSLRPFNNRRYLNRIFVCSEDGTVEEQCYCDFVWVHRDEDSEMCCGVHQLEVRRDCGHDGHQSATKICFYVFAWD